MGIFNKIGELLDNNFKQLNNFKRKYEKYNIISDSIEIKAIPNHDFDNNKVGYGIHILCGNKINDEYISSLSNIDGIEKVRIWSPHEIKLDVCWKLFRPEIVLKNVAKIYGIEFNEINDIFMSLEDNS